MQRGQRNGQTLHNLQRHCLHQINHGHNSQAILNEAKQLAAAATVANTCGIIIAPAITTQSNAQDEADQLNLIHQEVIGAKEGAAEAISTKVGTDVTNSILKSADGANFCSIDDYQLEDVIAAVLQGADRPNTADILAQLLIIIQFSLMQSVFHYWVGLEETSGRYLHSHKCKARDGHC